MMKPKTHDYTQQQQGHHYVIEPVTDKKNGNATGICQYAVTGYGSNIQTYDYLLLKRGNAIARYLVQHIEHYCAPTDMWTALLLECR